MPPVRWLVTLIPLIGATGCVAPTSVLLVVDSDLEPRTELENLAVTVSRDGETLWVGTHGFDLGEGLPQTLRILPGSSSSNRLSLSVTARRGSEDLLTVTRQSSFRQGREVVERVCLHSACIGSAQPECAQGLCDLVTADGDADSDVDADTDVDGDTDADGNADGCVPGPELCNGVDDDCDPTTPDGADEVSVGIACDGADDDLCEEGSMVCVDGEVACDDETGDAAETCNGADDDCDGVIDQGAICPCEQRWSGSHAYLLCAAPSPWTTARISCLDLGYDLVAIEDELENDFLTRETTAIDASEAWWIGLSDRDEEGVFLWAATGLPPSWENWRSGEPNDTAPGEDCVETNFSTPGLWNDSECPLLNPYVCETGGAG